MPGVESGLGGHCGPCEQEQKQTDKQTETREINTIAIALAISKIFSPISFDVMISKKIVMNSEKINCTTKRSAVF